MSSTSVAIANAPKIPQPMFCSSNYIDNIGRLSEEGFQELRSQKDFDWRYYVGEHIIHVPYPDLDIEGILVTQFGVKTLFEEIGLLHPNLTELHGITIWNFLSDLHKHYPRYIHDDNEVANALYQRLVVKNITNEG